MAKQLDLKFNAATREASVVSEAAVLEEGERIIFGDVMDNGYEVDASQTDEQLEALAENELELDSAMFDLAGESLTIDETRAALLVMLKVIRDGMKEGAGDTFRHNRG